MASQTQITRIKRRQKLRKAGRRRKNKLAKQSTVSANELFAGLSGQPEPAQESKQA